MHPHVLPLFVLLAVSALLRGPMAVADAAAFQEYTYSDHPLHTFDQFTATRPTPVIMHKYYTQGKRGKSARGMRFMPGVATYMDQLGNPVLSGLDALIGRRITPRTPVSTASVDEDVDPNPDADAAVDAAPEDEDADAVDPPPAAEVHLNGAARVFILLSGGKNFRAAVAAAIPDTNDPLPDIDVTGLSGWTTTRILQNPDYKARIPEPRGGGAKLPRMAVALERTYAAGEVISISSKITVAGMAPMRATLLFAQPIAGAIHAFDAPAMPDPSAVAALAPGTDASIVPVPNTRCPDWVHDIHVVANEDSTGPAYWKTWHPIIDSVYWCYFEHDHGSFPGEYRPPFGYTAYRTPDSSTADGRQDESHNGFKIFSWEFGNHAAVATVHAHLAFARRFTARKHTLLFAVFDVDASGNWDRLLELRMKADFGPKQVRREISKLQPATAEDAALDAEMKAAGVRAGRRFNVRNAELNSGTDPVQFGRYEQWKTQLNTCAFAPRRMRGLSHGFQFDFRNAQTDMADMEGSDIVPTGKSGMRRDLKIGRSGFTISRDLCAFTPTSDASGVFFTDPYFSEAMSGEGDFNVRQFIRPDFTSIDIPSTRLFMSDVWNGHMQAGTKIFLQNIERAIDPMVN